MKKRAWLLLAGLILAALLGINSAALATTASDCTSCHNQQALNFTVNPMTRTTACYVCHVGASHALWRDPVTGRSKYAVWVAGSGFFRSVASVNAPAANLHTYHSGNNAYSNRADCNMCHGVTYCISCHNNTVNHRQHGSSAFNPISFAQANGTAFTNQSLTCASAQCHQKMPTVVKTRTDGNQLCVNCHPRFGYSAKDSTGHLQTAIDSRHSAPAAGILSVGAVPQSVTCTGCHSSNLGTEHANKGKDCVVCHNPSAPIPASVKSVVLNAKGDQSKRACTLCHFNSNALIVPDVHPTYHIANQGGNSAINVVGGPHTSCDTCHNTAAPLVISTTVNSVVYKVSIAELAAMPTKNYSCFGCHNADNNLTPKHKASLEGQEMELTELHAGCTTCHTPGTDFAARVSTIAAGLKNGATSYECTECHSGAALDEGHAGIIDENCLTCHQAALTTEHLNNPKTQAGNTNNPLTCSTCHRSDKPEVKLAIVVGNTNCLACHNQAHNFNMAQPVPNDIPLYQGFTWSTPQAADIWSSEPWMPAGYEGGKIVISNRRTDVSGAAVWSFYKQQMADKGWVVPADPANTNFFSAEFTKNRNRVTVFFYGGENHAAAPVVSTGYRIEILYR